MTTPCVFLEQEFILGQILPLPKETTHYLSRVLRLRPPAEVMIINSYSQKGTGGLISPQSIKVMEVTDDNIDIRVRINLITGLCKREQLDSIIQKATELGVFRIIPFLSERSAFRPPYEAERKMVERWKRICIESLRQVKTGPITEIQNIGSFSEVVTALSQNDGAINILLWEKEREVSFREILRESQFRQPAPVTLNLITGPEGGFSENEVELLAKAKVKSASIGRRILKAETAVLFALSVIQSETNWGRL